MPDGIQSIVRLFADDTIAYVTISSDADAANLQQDLDKLGFVGDVFVPFKKTDGVVGFRADGTYMFTPFEV
jgi:hypothetical protein